jgi:hypothetical protein
MREKAWRSRKRVAQARERRTLLAGGDFILFRCWHRMLSLLRRLYAALVRDAVHAQAMRKKESGVL